MLSPPEGAISHQTLKTVYGKADFCAYGPSRDSKVPVGIKTNIQKKQTIAQKPLAADSGRNATIPRRPGCKNYSNYIGT